jgi:phosphoribosylformylglycinamidine (FGAM) synthase-like enzyme/phosphoribosylformylglycinamidine (FGAM) synthase PurS component
MSTARMHRVEVRPRDGVGDPRGDAIRREAAHLGVEASGVRSARIYLVRAAIDDAAVDTVRTSLLTDPVLEVSRLGADMPHADVRTIEVHPLPGVMDPAAQTVQTAVRELTGADEVEVSTGWRYDFTGVTDEQADLVARRLLANTVVEAIHRTPWLPEDFPHAAGADQTVRHVQITTLDDAALEVLSREGHLFLSLDEMRAIREEYRTLGREPTDIELETLAQTWSEHCVHKTLKSTIRITPADDDVIDWSNRPGHEIQPDGSVVIHNLLKSTVAAATHELIDEGIDWTLSVFVDNAGIIRFDDDHAVCVKVETHNHPSAIEPYGGAATGIGGVIRDIIGTGLGARPIANTDVFCVAFPDHFTTEHTEGTESGSSESPGLASGSDRAHASEVKTSNPTSAGSVPSVVDLPSGCLHPRRVLTRVVDGVRDYGNRMGIPTVNGTVYFDDRYVGNPLVFCGSVGVMPADMCHGDAQPGDRIIALGGPTGRDGIHGATFSSAELTDTHADEFSHAVQIGNAIEEKRVLDAIMRARDYFPSEAAGSGQQATGKGDSDCLLPTAHCLYSAITDCGAGGFSSAVGEMGEKLGAEVHLEHAPLKYAGLRYDEIWISESQERMVLAVPPENVAALQAICDEEHVELADLGHFGTDNAELILHFEGTEVGRLPMAFLHDGIPMPVREAEWGSSDGATKRRSDEGSGAADVAPSLQESLLRLLAHPNIASKHWIVRQYDHEVQGNTIAKPLVGPGGIGPGDAAVIQPVPGSKQGLAIACGLQTPLGDPAIGGDPYVMALAAVDECVRNLVCVGADPQRIAILDNFCWPSCAKPENLGSLVRAAEGCYDAAKAYRTPFVSGKDSLNNQFRYVDPETGEQITIEIPPTLLITGIGIVPDVSKVVTSDAKRAGNVLVHVGLDWLHMAGSLAGSQSELPVPFPLFDAAEGAHMARFVAWMIDRGDIVAAHDISDGGELAAIAEMLIGSNHDLGFTRDAADVSNLDASERFAAFFNETPGRYLLEMTPEAFEAIEHDRPDEFRTTPDGDAITFGILGTLNDTSMLNIPNLLDVPVSDLRTAYLGTLDW